MLIRMEIATKKKFGDFDFFKKKNLFSSFFFGHVVLAFSSPRFDRKKPTPPGGVPIDYVP